MNQRGQIMLLSIVILGGVMIGAAAIGSFLLRTHISQVNNAVDSTKALFAADAGIEAVSWCFFEKAYEEEEGEGPCSADTYQGPPNNGDTFCPEDNQPSVSVDGSSVNTTCRWDKEEGVVKITSQAFNADTTRILEAQFVQRIATSTATSTEE